MKDNKCLSQRCSQVIGKKAERTCGIVCCFTHEVLFYLYESIFITVGEENAIYFMAIFLNLKLVTSQTYDTRHPVCTIAH